MKSKEIPNVLLCSPFGGVKGGIHRWTEHIMKYNTETTNDINLELLPMDRSYYVNLEHNFHKRIMDKK